MTKESVGAKEKKQKEKMTVARGKKAAGKAKPSKGRKKRGTHNFHTTLISVQCDYLMLCFIFT